MAQNRETRKDDNVEPQIAQFGQAIQKSPRFLCVDYPGVVKNVEKAIDTLGGLNKLAHDYFKTAALDLDYHRDNIYSRTACSRRRTGTFLIVKIRRRKPRPSINEILDESSEQLQQPLTKSEDVEGEILGVVSSMHRFTCMFDFQYLPLKRTASSQQQQQAVYEDLLPKLFPRDMKSVVDWFTGESASTSATNSDTDLFLPPFAFSRFTLPSFAVLGREPQQTRLTKGAVTAATSRSSVVGLSLRKERRLPCCMVHGHEPFPLAPHPDTAAQADQKCKFLKPHEIVKTMFEQRPMWSKNAFLVETGLEETLLKCLMPKYGFYILSGPFGRVWCRFGYDPRKDRSAVVYQTIMINLSKLGFGGADTLRIGYKVPAANRLKVTSRGVSTGREVKNSKPGKNWYIFEDGVLPPFRQVWYQIADIRLPSAEEETVKALSVDEPMFRDGHSESTSAGWLLPGAADRMREAMKESLRTTMDKLDKELNLAVTEGSLIPSSSDSEEESQEEEEAEEENEYFIAPGVTPGAAAEADS